mmetsp:Transcript_6665/g.11786  ORF Transcript_6665/g.11786 Transcript_6665/m.11786 type:complete len:135 (+) Transcript_6665:3138-3542(+)
MALNPKHWVYKAVCPDFLAKKLVIYDLVTSDEKFEPSEEDVLKVIRLQWKAMDSFVFLTLGLYSLGKILVGKVHSKQHMYFAGVKLLGYYTTATLLTDRIKVQGNYQQFQRQLSSMKVKYSDRLVTLPKFNLKI